MSSIKVIGGGSVELTLPQANPHVLHEVVTWQLAKRRRGTASTKTRANVSRTGKKLYSQKGTGNARHGDRAAPIYVGGGVAFGPHPRDYSYTLPRKVRSLGLKMAVSARAQDGKIVAVGKWNVEPKTKAFVAWAKSNGYDGGERVLVVADDVNVRRAAANLPWVTVMPVVGLNAYDILRHDQLLIDEAALHSEALKYEAKEKTEIANTKKKKTVIAKNQPLAKKVIAETIIAKPVAKTAAQAAAVSASTATSTKAVDDLTRIEGVGPKINSALNAAGIHTFSELAAASEEKLKGALEAAGLRFAPSLGTWAEQSGYLARGDEAGFKALTDALVAGRNDKDGEA